MGQLKEGLERYEDLPRDEYFAKNQELGERLWDSEVLPTVADIAQLVRGVTTPAMKGIFDFFENSDSFQAMANHVGASYEESESASFIRDVMSSNNTDISKAGYFYKLLMASADDFVVVHGDCGAEGRPYQLKTLTEDVYDYRIRGNWVDELGTFAVMGMNRFLKVMGDRHPYPNWVHVRSPLCCAAFPHDTEEHKRQSKNRRGICSCCAGHLPRGIQNLGAFTALMVTEHATQSALNSMNKGRKKDINDTLVGAYRGEYNWGGISRWIDELTEDLKGDQVSSRFYEIALMSRVRFDDDGPYVSSMASSINRSGNLFGSYIFVPTEKNLRRMINQGRFEDDSMKLQIAMNQYDDETNPLQSHT